MAACDPDSTVEVCSSPANPVFVEVTTSGGAPATQPVSVADGADVTLGAKADAEVSGAGAASVVAILKRIRTLLGFSLGAGTTDATTLRVITASDGPLNTNLGTTADAAVDTDTTGSVSGKLRGLVKLMVNLLSRWPAALGGGGGLKVENVAAAGTATHTADQAVDATAGGVTVLAANAARKAAFVENVGTANIRVSIGGTPTATNGLQVVPGATLIIEGGPAYGCPTVVLKAIREGSVSSSVAVVEVA